MILLETNKGHYKRNFGDVFLQDPVLLARLIVNYFAKKGFIPDERKTSIWNNDLSNNGRKEGKYKASNWEYDWHNDGVTFKFKDNEKDEWPDGVITIGIKEGYAITDIHTRDSNDDRIHEKYKISLNKTVLELCQTLVKKYRLHKKGKTDNKEVNQAGSQEKTFVNLLEKNNLLRARFDENRNTFVIWPQDFTLTFSDEKSRKLIRRVMSGHKLEKNFILEETREYFIKVARYIIQKYAKQGFALSIRGFNFYVAMDQGVTLPFVNGNKEEIEEGMAYFEQGVERVRQSEDTKTKEQYASSIMTMLLKEFFEDDYKRKEIIKQLEHI